MLRVEGEGGITFNINKDVQIRLTSIFSMRLDFYKVDDFSCPPILHCRFDWSIVVNCFNDSSTTPAVCSVSIIPTDIIDR